MAPPPKEAPIFKMVPQESCFSSTFFLSVILRVCLGEGDTHAVFRCSCRPCYEYSEHAERFQGILQQESDIFSCLFTSHIPQHQIYGVSLKAGGRATIEEKIGVNIQCTTNAAPTLEVIIDKTLTSAKAGVACGLRQTHHENHIR